MVAFPRSEQALPCIDARSGDCCLLLASHLARVELSYPKCARLAVFR